MIPHGGGVTPISQTVDTHLNHHVKRLYAVKESAELIQQMRQGQVVPCAPKERCIDMMHDVISDKALHVKASAGYKHTGATIALNGDEDGELRREPAHFFNELGMRQKIDCAVEAVREERQAGRLQWTKYHVRKLIGEYPPKPKYDKVLEKIHEYSQYIEDEKGYLSDESEAAVAAEDEEEALEKEEYEEDHDSNIKADDVALEAENCGEGDAVQLLSHEHDCMIRHSIERVDSLKRAIEEVNAQGLMNAAGSLESELRKEKKRQRCLRAEDPAVAEGLRRQHELEEQNLRMQRRAAAELQEASQMSKDLKRALNEANAKLKRRKQEIAQIEAAIESEHHLKTFAVESLGKGGGKGQQRKRRHEVMDRVSRCGTGLSASQRNDFTFFKEAWDDKMLQEHGGNWGGVFAGYMQGVIDKLKDGVPNAFSTFMHDETVRCLGDVLALQVPGVATL